MFKYEYEAATQKIWTSLRKHILYSGISEKSKVKCPAIFSKDTINLLFVGQLVTERIGLPAAGLR